MIRRFNGIGIAKWEGSDGSPRCAYHFGDQVLGHLFISRDYPSPEVFVLRVHVTGNEAPQTKASVPFVDVVNAQHPWEPFAEALRTLSRDTGIPVEDLSEMANISGQFDEVMRGIRELTNPRKAEPPAPAPPAPPVEMRTVDLKKGWDHWMNNIVEGIMRAPRKVPRAIVKKDGDA